jgi:hypothetical protein
MKTLGILLAIFTMALCLATTQASAWVYYEPYGYYDDYYGPYDVYFGGPGIVGGAIAGAGRVLEGIGESIII